MDIRKNIEEIIILIRSGTYTKYRGIDEICYLIEEYIKEKKPEPWAGIYDEEGISETVADEYESNLIEGLRKDNK